MTVYQPKKKPKSQELTQAEKAEEPEHLQHRILVEHVISGVTRYRIVEDVFRNTKAFLLIRRWKLPTDYKISVRDFVIRV